MTPQVTKIYYEFFSGNLLAPEVARAYDEQASAERYAIRVSYFLERAYPQAEIEVSYQEGSGSCRPYTLEFNTADGVAPSAVEDTERRHINAMLYDIFTEGAWLVGYGMEMIDDEDDDE